MPGQAQYPGGASTSPVKGKAPDEERSDPSTKPSGPDSREKPLSVSKPFRPVPRTNTRGQGENPEASERTVAKELCKTAS